MDRWWRSLAVRATLVVGALLAALACILIAITSADMREAAESAIERAAFVQIEQAASDFDAARFPALINSDAAYAYVADGAGAVIAGAAPTTPPPTLDGPASPDASSAPRVARSGGVVHAAKTLRLADGAPGALRLGLSLEPAWLAARDVAVRALFATLCFLALALPALAILVDRVAAPLRELARAVARPGATRDAMRAAGGRRDEVGALARAHLSIARDLAENADALHRLTFDDPLTRLPNRASLTSRLAVALQLGQPAALLKIEVEGLSRVAAGLGQSYGDDAIRRAADRLGAVVTAWTAGAGLSVDDTVTLARGSDSGFALLARGADADAAQSLAEAALAAFEEPLKVGDHLVAASLSIGVALAPADGDEAGALLRSAAAAVSASRAAGPKTVRFAGAELNRMAYGRLKLEQDLRRAIGAGELELHYQPQIALKTGAVSGAEALVRWRHPIRGMVSPADFVPVAEECGLIEPLGRFVLAEAARAAADWRARGVDLRVAVNVSAIEFKRPDFAATTLAIIRDAGADPADIELEITESAAMGDPAHAARELAPLKEAGVRIAIDDFGTGYSNLAALTRLPVDVLKIDRGFVKDAATEAGSRVVVGAVIGLAENLGFETVAEGVETADQLAFVTSQGATHVQGYLFAKPMPAPALEAWRAERLIVELRSVRSRAPAGIAAEKARA